MREIFYYFTTFVIAFCLGLIVQDIRWIMFFNHCKSKSQEQTTPSA